MSLIINGVEIPTNGNCTYRGSEIDKIICNGVEVWKKQTEPITYTAASIFPHRWVDTVNLTMTSKHKDEFYVIGHTAEGADAGYAIISTGQFTLPEGAKRVKFTVAYDIWGSGGPVNGYCKLIQSGETKTFTDSNGMQADSGSTYTAVFDVSSYTTIEIQAYTGDYATGKYGDGSYNHGYWLGVAFRSIVIEFT